MNMEYEWLQLMLGVQIVTFTRIHPLCLLDEDYDKYHYRKAVIEAAEEDKEAAKLADEEAAEFSDSFKGCEPILANCNNCGDTGVINGTCLCGGKLFDYDYDPPNTVPVDVLPIEPDVLAADPVQIP